MQLSCVPSRPTARSLLRVLGFSLRHCIPVKMKSLSASSGRLVVLLLVVCFSRLAESQNCGKQARGALCSSRSLCCSKWGFCGMTTEHCGAGCQSGACTGGNPPSSSGRGLRNILSRDMFAAWFPNRNPFYRYDALIVAADSYAMFAAVGTITAQKRKVAAFFAHMKQETSGTGSAIAMTSARTW